jgi:3-methyl-2-oxobutanoate hydroxymethyltransferase
MKTTTQTIRTLKGKRPVVCVTAYDTLTAHLADLAGIDLILVGDSVGTTHLGFDTTIPVTLDMILHHTGAVARAKPSALVVADIPFVEAHLSIDTLLVNCRRLMQQAGAEAVKIEGGQLMADKVAALVLAGIPVLGHIGLLPQSYYAMGGYRKTGKSQSDLDRLVQDARALQEAGAFAIIGEMIHPATSAHITSSIDIPFIGIGCGPDCDGQILVSSDLLGLNPGGKYPSFVKLYASLGEQTREAFSRYADEVRGRVFPESRQL